MGSPLDAETVKLISITQTYFAAMYAVALWDWIICLPKEYRRIWKAPFSLIKVLYYCNRYYTLANLLLVLYGFYSSMTTAECSRFYKWEPGVASFTTIFAEAILVIRTYALWGKNKYILAGLLLGFTTECVVLLFAVTQFQAVPTRDPTDPESRGACIAGGGPGGHDWSMAYWVSPIVMDTIMLILTSIRALQYRNRGVKSTVFQTFVRDGIYQHDLLLVAQPSPSSGQQPDVSSGLCLTNSHARLYPMTSIMCSHIVLSLRGEEKEAMENVSRDWQVNTFLRKKKENGMSSSEKRGVIRSVIGGDHLPPSRDIDLHAFAPPLGTHPYEANGDNPSGVAPNEGYPDEKYGGVHVDVELGVAVENEKRSSETNAGAAGNSWNRNQSHGGA
ncbi:uncharacterized protein MELLADRAFT_84363 [Melampsora larici-populina 98AG31]|uniref:DUF6533 domain-containing protein n=1 Tax=Melampsora larici-populina (strain 98AG31 / pathotype 3-4-7) TaxID=747676 RepID=F4RFH7_MELLP|nr:uncharacterized protein MELLADRAFT_84363 [Melampsora larici-populina 98AG31]EGG08809.1 hypothetical protein MELLADRAFT_84363 [Melampsora larici-populina 98AG31]